MSLSTVWLINPHKLGTKGKKVGEKTMARTAKKTTPRKKPRTAAQKAATAKLVALNKKRHRAPAKKASTSHGTTAKKRNYSKKKRSAAAAPAPVKRHYKRNPVPKTGFVGELVHDIAIPAGLGIAGAIGTDAVWGNLKFIPVAYRAGTAKYFGKAAIGLGAGLLLGLHPKTKRAGQHVAIGTLIAQGYTAGTALIQSKYPNLGLAGYDDDELAEVIEELNGLDADLSLPAPAENGMAGFGFYTPTYDSATA